MAYKKLTSLSLTVLCVLTCSHSVAQDRTETLSKDSIVTIALIDEKHVYRNLFINELFPQVLPAIKEVGGRVVARFETIGVSDGNYTPQHLMLLEWPSLEAFEVAAKDSRNLNVLDQRRLAMRDFTIGFFKIERNTHLKLSTNIVYDFFGVSLPHSVAIEHWLAFQKVVEPIAEDLGRVELLRLEFVQSERNGWSRSFAGINAWSSPASSFRFRNTSSVRRGLANFRKSGIGAFESITALLVE